MWWTTALAMTPTGDPFEGWPVRPADGSQALVLLDEAAIRSLEARPLDPIHGDRSFHEVRLYPSDGGWFVYTEDVGEIPCLGSDVEVPVRPPVVAGGTVRFSLPWSCADGAPATLSLRADGATVVESCGVTFRARPDRGVRARYRAAADAWTTAWLTAEGLPLGAGPGTVKLAGREQHCEPLYDHGATGPGAPEPLVVCSPPPVGPETVLGRHGARPDVVVHRACEFAGWMTRGE